MHMIYSTNQKVTYTHARKSKPIKTRSDDVTSGSNTTGKSTIKRFKVTMVPEVI